MESSPRKILGVGPNAGMQEARRAYRKLAMKWHPDRNADPTATARFQEIQSAYRKLAADLDPAAALERREQAVEQMMRREAREEEEKRRAGVAERRELGILEQAPLAALAILAAGFWGFAELPGILGWGALSAAALAAGAAYKPGISPPALRAEFFFKNALRLYFFALLVWAVWALARKNLELLPATF